MFRQKSLILLFYYLIESNISITLYIYINSTTGYRVTRRPGFAGSVPESSSLYRVLAEVFHTGIVNDSTLTILVFRLKIEYFILLNDQKNISDEK